MSALEDASETIATAVLAVAGALRDGAADQAESNRAGLHDVAMSLNRVAEALIGIEQALRECQAPPRPGRQR